MMDESIYKWLANYFSDGETRISTAYIAEMLKAERATAFLLIWPIFEQRFTKDGFFKFENIGDIAKNYSGYYAQLDVEEMVKYFHYRYQDKDNYRHLNHGKKHAEITEIKETLYHYLNDNQKLTLMLYVVYRYRNNIFHGNKGIQSWSQYGDQIDYCIQFMMRMLDLQKKNCSEAI